MNKPDFMLLQFTLRQQRLHYLISIPPNINREKTNALAKAR